MCKTISEIIIIIAINITKDPIIKNPPENGRVVEGKKLIPISIVAINATHNEEPAIATFLL